MKSGILYGGQVNHILIEEKDFDKGLLKPGDIITYLASNDHHFIHQIIDIVVEDGERIYTLQGTNNAIPDIDRVTNDMIESVVVAIIYARERINQ